MEQSPLPLMLAPRRGLVVENAAFHLHCSPRQLQRVLNALERDGVVSKCGKGTYELKIS